MIGYFINLNTKNKFWIYPEEIQTDKVYASTYSEEDSVKISSRDTQTQNLIKVDIRDLYNATLYNTVKTGSWGLNDKKEFLPLKNRYEFVKFAVDHNFKLTDEQIIKTDYFKLLSVNNVDTVPRDGSSQGVYAEPMQQAKYFLELIKKIFETGYCGNSSEVPDPNNFTKEKVAMLDSNGGGYDQARSSSNFITITFEEGAPRIANGLHRSSIVYRMLEMGLVDDPFICVQLARQDTNSSDGSDEMLTSLEDSRILRSLYGRAPNLIRLIIRLFIVTLVAPYFLIDKFILRTKNLITKIQRIF